MGTMPGAKTKSPTLIGKTRTAQRIPIRSSSRSDISNVEPARASRNKISARSHIVGASLIISPSSSVDSMSSVLSVVSTASNIGKASHTSESFSTRSSSLSPSIRKSNEHPPTTKPRPLTVTEGTTCGNLKSNIDTSTQANGFRPSGLRRPTPKIRYFDAEKSVEQKAARVQLQSTKALFSPLATPNPRISSTPKANFEFSTSDQQELKSMAAALFQTKASPSLPLRVATAVGVVSKQRPQVTPKEPTVARLQESEVTAAPHEESSPCQTKVARSLSTEAAKMEVEPSEVIDNEACIPQACPPSLPLGVAEIEVEPPSEMIDHEACVSQACSVFASADNAKENIQPSGAQSPLKGNILASHENIHAKGDMTLVKGNILALHPNMQAIGDMTPVTLLTQKPSCISPGPANGEATPFTLLAQKLSSISLQDATD